MWQEDRAHVIWLLSNTNGENLIALSPRLDWQRAVGNKTVITIWSELAPFYISPVAAAVAADEAMTGMLIQVWTDMLGIDMFAHSDLLACYTIEDSAVWSSKRFLWGDYFTVGPSRWKLNRCFIFPFLLASNVGKFGSNVLRMSRAERSRPSLKRVFHGVINACPTVEHDMGETYWDAEGGERKWSNKVRQLW
jgi:hypothetical protein